MSVEERSFGGLATAEVLDDQGQPHRLVLADLDPMIALNDVLPKVESLSRADLLDLVLDGAVFRLLDEDEQEEEQDAVIEQALARTANALLTSGDGALVLLLLRECTRDEVALSEPVIRDVYRCNLGELRRTLELVLRRNFLDFFVTRATVLRTFGARAMERAIKTLRGKFKPESVAAVLRGFSGSLSSLAPQAGAKSATDGASTTSRPA